MSGPAWLAGIFAAVMLSVAVYCASRLVAARRWQRPTDLDTDGVHIVMGVAMAGMLVAGLRFLSAGIWEAVFAGAGVWFGWQFLRVRRGVPVRQWRCPDPVPHLVECGAMLYMFLALPALKSRSGMNGMALTPTASRFSLVALVLALFMFGYVVRVADRVAVRTPAVAVAVDGSMAMTSGPEPGAGAPQDGRGSDGQARPYLAPRCAALCKIAMGITMGYMLIMML